MVIEECAPLLNEAAFRKHGLRLDLVQAPGGAVIVDSIIGGSLDFGYSNLVSPILARSRGINLAVFAGCTYEDSTHAGHGLMVLPNSDIKSARDLKGKSIAVNTLRNIDHLMLARFLKGNGVSLDEVHLVEIPFQRMDTVLKQGAVQAAAVVEPFLTKSKDEQLKCIGDYFLLKPEDRIEVTSYVAKRSWLSKNPEIAKAFQEALHDSVAYYATHEDDFRNVIQKMTKLDAKLTARMVLPAYGQEPTRDGIELLVQEMKAQRFINADYSVTDLIWSPQ
jgi:NitT/TauT family transport system substrate-binding protein